MRLYNRLNRWSLPAADRVVTVCRPFADSLARAGVAEERIRVLPNSIAEAPHATDEEIRDLRGRLGLNQKERVILSIGRFSREKAQADLIEAAAHLTRLHPDLAFRLVLVGDGPERQAVEQAASGLAGRVVCAGHQTNVRPYYAVADIFVLPSHSEGSPNVILEAMAAGVPIVATAVGGVPEMLADGESALLAPAGAPEALAEAMGSLLTNEELATRLARNASASVAQRFSPDAYRRALLGVYAELSPPTDREALRGS
jgi:glycosyltransferase involved in cell wall biosynthesis